MRSAGEGLEGLARAGYLDMSVPGRDRAWERAYAGLREAGDPIGAVRIARTLGRDLRVRRLGTGPWSGGWMEPRPTFGRRRRASKRAGSR